jgi:hypothetical protein
MKRLIYIALALTLAVACKSSHKPTTDSEPTNSSTTEQTAKQLNFIPALAPAMLPQEQKMEYMREHYWDKFDFADTTFINQIDSTKMLTAFAVYATGYIPDSLAYKYMPRLMQRASTSKRMYTYFLMLAEGVLHDPNSPLRNDEKYIPVLENAVQSSLLDEYERMPYEYDLEIARQNRIGRIANDFTYTLPSGRTATLHNIKADYTLIFISNPGCPMCREVKEQITTSPMLQELIERKELKVLVIYPDTDLEAWREHLQDYPASWINGYDADQRIEKERLYDLKAIPALYLLDKQKRVMAKDCTDVAYIEKLLSE